MNKLYGDNYDVVEPAEIAWLWNSLSSLSCPRCDGPMTAKEHDDLGHCSPCYLEEFRATARIGRPL